MMQVYRQLEAIQLPASACAIGMFDGVHLGHRMVLENAIREARFLGVKSVVFSFADHPQFLISQTPTRLISSLEERLAAFEAMGFDHALILDFDEQLKSLSAQDFIDQILIDRLAVQSVTVGYDHRFGQHRKGDGEFLRQAGERQGFAVHIIDPVKVDGQIASSTLIRKLLSFGDLAQANTILGRPYTLVGTVEPGLQRGRQLGFPTANLAIDAHRLVPAVGTYSGFAVLGGATYPAVCNIGLSPTFGDQTQKRVEVHLMDYTGEEFYGETLIMGLWEKLRDEQRFGSVDALIAQIRKDCATAHQHSRNYLDNPFSRPPHVFQLSD